MWWGSLAAATSGAYSPSPMQQNGRFAWRVVDNGCISFQLVLVAVQTSHICRGPSVLVCLLGRLFLEGLPLHVSACVSVPKQLLTCKAYGQLSAVGCSLGTALWYANCWCWCRSRLLLASSQVGSGCSRLLGLCLHRLVAPGPWHVGAFVAGGGRWCTRLRGGAAHLLLQQVQDARLQQGSHVW